MNINSNIHLLKVKAQRQRDGLRQTEEHLKLLENLAKDPKQLEILTK